MIEADVQIADSIKFVKRIGARAERGGKPRPLLIGFKYAEGKQKMMDNTRKLADRVDTWKEVSIIHDLTKMQREEEQKMRTEAERLTKELSDEDQKNWLFKVVGRRGERRVMKVSLEKEAERAAAGRGRRARSDR